MGNITVAVLGASGYSSSIGKKGTSTDITLYDLKKGNATVTFIEATRYPERLAPLFYACSLASKAIVVVDELTAQLGEQLVMLQCCGIQSGYFVLRNYIPKEKIEPLLKGTCLEKFEFIPDDPNQLREKLLTQAAEQTPSESQTGTVPVDHAFNVKGVGVVVLGIVVSGTIHKHAALNVLPYSKTAQVRSIQKHDDESESASTGDRVGLALKNVNIEDLDRGAVLTNDPEIKTSNKLQAQALLVKYWQTPIKDGMVMHIGHWTQFLTAKIEAVSDAEDFRKPNLTLSIDKPLAYHPGDTAVLMYLEGTKLRVAGTILLV
ncbi:MAG: elongation factor Tu [Nitrososphaerota archaeon]|jgi:selenocysteine-specific translation elongation factor|uniref:EF-Tu/IF-2/RF-3 family GTPase n=1 Tax=Candidatus Bathycorpusculum sp. TaxID=2994959 RepID=UPI00282FD9EE|nr:EF-Tu/IF-2/RF-3 family GTPase [Candidatus Termitimicrobium sp.]MCL2431600.1 EF-Tu/IF-2/RF-3 family GTPase [Candidatus Termitimicrobium sp.]MDR0493963.1 elongation factor Tu [Nitrososphaerota archaeon]